MKNKVLAKVFIFLLVLFSIIGIDGVINIGGGSTVYASPSTVVSSAYDTSGNGGRKLVRLSNGWIISAMKNGTTNVQLYVSKDNGTNWSNLFIIANSNVTGLTISSYGTKVYVLLTYTDGSFNQFYSVDAVNCTGGQEIHSVTGSTYTLIDTNQTVGSYGQCSMAVDSYGVIHATWCSKNSTYSNSFNIRYSKSTDGGITWATPIFMPLVWNASGYDATNPCIVVKSNSKPVIVFQVKANTNYYIKTCYYDGSSWQGGQILDAGTYTQSNPCAVVDSNDNIHVVWHGTDSTDTTKPNIRYSKSTDGGATWSAAIKLTSGNSYDQTSPSISFDKNGYLYALWQGTSSSSPTYTRIRRSSYINGSWSYPTDLTSNTISNTSNVATLYDNNTNDLTVKYIYADSQNNSVKFDTDQLDATKVVAFQPYDTSGNGGRKLVRLSNGTIVASCADSGSNPYKIRYYKSIDNGATWSTAFISIADSGKYAICTDGTYIYQIATDSPETIRLRKYDISGTQSVYALVDTQTSFGTGISLAIDSNGTLHAAWCSKNSTYPNSFNIRYSKSIDGGATWATPTYPSSDINNVSGIDNINPSIITKSNNNPVIVWQKDTGTIEHRIYSDVYNGSSWNIPQNVYYMGANYSQSNPCAVVDENGNIHVVWDGRDSTDTTKPNIRYSKSTDGGSTWSAATKLTSGNSNQQYSPSISTDKNNNLYVFWHGYDSSISTSVPNIRKIEYKGSWSTISTLTNNTIDSAFNVQTMEKSDNSVRWLYVDGQAKSVKFDTIVLNQNPIIGSTIPTSNQQFTNVYNLVVPQISVSDAENDILTCKYYLDSESSPRDTKPNINPSNTPTVIFNNLDLSALSIGIHTIKFEVSDGLSTVTQTINININPQAPSITINNAAITSSTVDTTITDTNPTYTYYELMCNGKYVSSNGTLTTVPTWIKLPTKNITVKGLKSGATYNFKVKARNEAGVQTPFSPTVQATTLANPTVTPTNLKTTLTDNSITLSWDASDYATGYDIEVDGSSTLVNANINKYTHNGLNQNTTHTYRVRAKNTLGASKWSSMISATTLLGKPNIPANFTADPNSTCVVLTWNTVQDCTYELEADGEVINVGTNVTYTQKNLQLATDHTYRIRAINSTGTGDWSTLITTQTQLDAPSTPINIANNATNNSITLSWDEVIDATSYDIEVDGITYSNDDSTSFTQNNLAINSIHSFKVRAVNSMGTSNWSNLINVTTLILTAPTNITISSDESSITLNWASVADATGYDVEVDGASQDNGNNAKFIHNGLNPDSEHKYRIRAKNGAGVSAWSEEIVAYSLPVKPNNPANVFAISKKDQVILTWDTVADSTGYQVEVDGAVVNNDTSNKYTDNGLTPNTQHTYRVRAINDSIEGDWSNLITLTTPIDKLIAPENVVIRGAGSIVTISWDSVVGATGYDLEVDGVTKDMGNRTSYTHRRVNGNIEHIYKVRSRSNTQTSAWSGKIINNSILAQGTKGKDVDLGLTANDVTDFSQYTLTVWYDKDVLEVVDLSTLTKDMELQAGTIKGTDIIVTSFTPGKIVFTVGKEVPAGESWTGVINNIKFKAKLTGGTAVNYVVNVKPEEE